MMPSMFVNTGCTHRTMKSSLSERPQKIGLSYRPTLTLERYSPFVMRRNHLSSFCDGLFRQGLSANSLSCSRICVKLPKRCERDLWSPLRRHAFESVHCLLSVRQDRVIRKVPLRIIETYPFALLVFHGDRPADSHRRGGAVTYSYPFDCMQPLRLMPPAIVSFWCSTPASTSALHWSQSAWTLASVLAGWTQRPSEQAVRTNPRTSISGVFMRLSELQPNRGEHGARLAKEEAGGAVSRELDVPLVEKVADV